MVRDGYDYNRNIGGRSILFPLAIVFCMMCCVSSGSFFSTSMNEQPARPSGAIGTMVSQGLSYKGVEDIKNVVVDEPIDDDFEVFIQAGKRLLFSMFMHWAAKYVFFFMALVCFSEWMRTTIYASPTKSRKSSSIKKKGDSRKSNKTKKYRDRGSHAY